MTLTLDYVRSQLSQCVELRKKTLGSGQTVYQVIYDRPVTINAGPFDEVWLPFRFAVEIGGVEIMFTWQTKQSGLNFAVVLTAEGI